MTDAPSPLPASVRLAPEHVLAFRACWAGAEDAVFGLASYAGREGYLWTSGCATQGAARRGGRPSFLAAHRAIITVLDAARSAGIKVTVLDDGEFWVGRDPKVLLDKLDEWETLSAALERRHGQAPSTSPRIQALGRAKGQERRNDGGFADLEG